jgi:hypothetical protein
VDQLLPQRLTLLHVRSPICVNSPDKHLNVTSQPPRGFHQQMGLRRYFYILLLLAASLADAMAEEAASPSAAAVKAGYLLNLAEFVEWPTNAFPDSAAPIILGILGGDPFGSELEKLNGRKIEGRAIEIRRFKGALEFRGQETPGRRQEDLAQKRNKKIRALKACHILFISSTEKDFVAAILKSLNDSSVLTVGELPGFTQSGGVVGFAGSGARIRIEINLAAAEEARLKISSKLLSLARVIGGKEFK